MHSVRTTFGRHYWLAGALVLLCVQLTLQIPLPSPEEPAPNSAPAGGYRPVEEARKLWNGAKKLARKTAPRVRRQNAITLENGMPPETEIGDNVTESAPKYILEVYRNLSYRPEPTEANTIRSLQTINTASDSVCGQYTFDFQGINSGEWILLAELRLYLQPTHFADPTVNYFVSVEEFRGHSEPVKILTEYISPSKSGLYEFKVTSIVSEWVATLARHPHRHFGFQINVYPTLESFRSSGTPFPCDESPIKFYSSKDARESENRDKEPLLAIFSFDPTTENIDLLSLINETSSNSSQEKRSADSEEEDGQRHRERRRRSGDSSATEVSLPIPSCRLNPLTITADHLNSINLIRNHRIIQPPSFDARICGGQCDRVFPRAPQIAMLVHLLINRRSLDRENYQYTSCCAPVEWEHLDLLSVAQNGAFQINRLKHMVVKRCECIDIVNYR